MTEDKTFNSFHEAASDWVCEGYSATIAFIALNYMGQLSILDAHILFSPLPPRQDNSFIIKNDDIYVGQFDLVSASKSDLLQCIDNAQKGLIDTPEAQITLPSDNPLSFLSDGLQRNLWFYQLHLSIISNMDNAGLDQDLSVIDNILRISNPPFDGLNDCANWLGLKNPSSKFESPSITIRINPPVDIIVDESKLENDIFEAVLHAHPALDTEIVTLATRGSPGIGISARRQVSSEIKWVDAENKIVGKASIESVNSDSVLSMLLIGKTLVRRQWFLDYTKARNHRLVAIQTFDKKLKRIRDAVLESTNSSKFEDGISALLFILGFIPCKQLETDSPDIIVQTPGGRLVLVECTTRVADFSSKLGKLVDRRGALVREMQLSGRSNTISIALICRQPRDQIVVKDEDLILQKALLITLEQLSITFSQLRNHSDPDQLLIKAESKLNTR